MTSFQSSDELFEAVAKLSADLDVHGHSAAAAELRSGLACLNGLTDGWALFLESIDKVKASHAKRFDDEERKALRAIRAAVHSAVYRR
jgi:hypothetical protein